MGQWDILIGCEESQAVCIEMRKRGHNAFSCDLQECSGGHPEWHLQMDIFEAIHLKQWDLLIAHPPCTYLSNVGQACKTRDNAKEFREAEALKAIQFVNKLWNCGILKICLENPVGQLNTKWKKPRQIIQPYYFGDNEMKTTCLWLRNLTRLNGIKTIDRLRDKPKPLAGKSRIGSDGKMKNVYFVGRMDRSNNSQQSAKLKSRTFPGIARTMAKQWTPKIKL